MSAPLSIFRRIQSEVPVGGDSATSTESPLVLKSKVVRLRARGKAKFDLIRARNP